MLLLFFVQNNFFGQYEEAVPLEVNPKLVKENSKSKASKEKIVSFDSTFIYTLDTVSLPFFDEFTTNKFQKYSNDYSLPGVTSQKHYKLLNNTTSVPLPADTAFTTQVTFRRSYNLTTSTATDVNFSPSQIKVGDFSSYPPVYATTDVYPPYYIYDTIGIVDEPDTVWIIGPDVKQDSAIQFFLTVTDPTKIWADSYVYHNYTSAYNPISLGVATFDGLDETGYPYSIGSTVTNYADVLTSKPIDLGANSPADSIYLSFLYQAKGLGDAPEAGDSLILEFYAKDLNQWNRIWGISAANVPVTEWDFVHVPIKNALYLKKGFQFRIRNYGALSGNLDLFHVDYVNLRTLSGYQDTLFKDYAFSYPVNTLLKDYTSVPWDHFKNNSSGKMSDKVQVVVRNNSNLAENFQNGSTEVFYNSLSEGTYTLMGQTLAGGNINYGPRTTYFSYHDFSSGYIYDNSKSGTRQEFSHLTQATAQFPNLGINDSTRNVQIFENYYSYDDGSAELAYGPVGVQARLAIQYTPYEADSVIGARIHFVPTVTDLSNKLFILTLWADNGGQPGTVLYEDNLFFPRSPRYQYGSNNFTYYFFEDTLKVPVTGTFYIGWRQLDLDRLNVGLDMNIDNKNKTFYSVTNGTSWAQSSFAGSVMIHPIFSTALDAELGLKEITDSKAEKWTVYPNPSEGQYNFDNEKREYWNVMDMTGRIMLSGNENYFDISHLPSGVYFLQPVLAPQNSIKLIKQ